MKKTYKQNGQILTALLYFVVVSVIITSAAVAVIIINANASNATQQGNVALTVGESGIENALVRLLRDPSYKGETLAVGDGQAVITVSGSNPLTIVSKGTDGGFTRQVTVNALYENNTLTITSWRQI